MGKSGIQKMRGLNKMLHFVCHTLHMLLDQMFEVRIPCDSMF
jgi:hypothetical protein